jgi:hypothetical protein
VADPSGRAVFRPLAHTPAFFRIRIRLRSWRFSHVPALPLPVAGTDHVYVVSLILNAAQVRRANSNAVALKLISRPSINNCVFYLHKYSDRVIAVMPTCLYCLSYNRNTLSTQTHTTITLFLLVMYC